MNNRIVTIDGVQNVRDLGGIPTKAGGAFKSQRIFRSAALHTVTPNGIKQMQDLGVKAVIDLRSTAETKGNPDPVEALQKAGIAYYHIPMLDNLQSNIAAQKEIVNTGLDVMYQHILDNHKEDFKKLLDIIRKTPTGGIFYHCSVGKDRTGITSMMLLSIAQVEDNYIIDDYSMSKPINGIGAKENPQIPSFIYEAPPVAMKKTLAWLEESYGGINGYLREIGINENEQEEIRKTLLA